MRNNNNDKDILSLALRGEGARRAGEGLGGSLYFISLGPGAAEMVTLGTLRSLEEAQKVYCFAVGGSSRAAEIIAQLNIDMYRTFAMMLALQ